MGYMMNLKNHIKLSLGYFLLAAILGLVLRSSHSVELPINFKFFVHTHSHIALLGWVYVALTTLLYKAYLDKQGLTNKYRFLFWFTQLTLVGMLFTFPFQGYALFSIVFSTLFLFASYWFTWFFIRNAPKTLKTTNSYICIKIALWYMVLSSLGPWALGGIMNTLGPESIWYRMAIYFYLHFQYNGWMVLALVGLLMYVFEKNDINVSAKRFNLFFWLINIGIILTFFLSIIWAKPSILLYVLGGIGALSQLIAFGIFIGLYIDLKTKILHIFSPFQRGLIKMVAVLLLIKMLLQILTSLPYFAHLAATILDFTIGYLHWTFLGVITLWLFLFLDYFGLIRIPKTAYSLYLLGFFTTEVLIFYKGMVQWLGFSLFNSYLEVLAVASVLIPISLIFLLRFNIGTNSPK